MGHVASCTCDFVNPVTTGAFRGELITPKVLSSVGDYRKRCTDAGRTFFQLVSLQAVQADLAASRSHHQGISCDGFHIMGKFSLVAKESVFPKFKTSVLYQIILQLPPLSHDDIVEDMDILGPVIKLGIVNEMSFEVLTCEPLSASPQLMQDIRQTTRSVKEKTGYLKRFSALRLLNFWHFQSLSPLTMNAFNHFSLVICNKSDVGRNHLPEESGLRFGKDLKSRLSSQLGKEPIHFSCDSQYCLSIIVSTHIGLEGFGGQLNGLGILAGRHLVSYIKLCHLMGQVARFQSRRGRSSISQDHNSEVLFRMTEEETGRVRVTA